MAVQRHQFKAGVFVVVLVAIGIAFVLWIGASGFNRAAAVHAAIYFDESVQGLNEGSEVKYRGWKIGEVATIDVAADNQHLLVQCLLREDFVDRFGVEGKKEGESTRIARGVVAALSSSGLTGLKFVDIDLVGRGEESAYTVPPGIAIPDSVELVIPSRASFGESIERALSDALDTFRSGGGDVGGALRELNGLLRTLNETRVVAKVTTAVERLDQRLDELDTKGLSDAAKAAVTDVARAVDRTSSELAVLTAPDGDLRHMIRSVDRVFAEVGTELKSADLPTTMTAVRENSEKVGQAADAVAIAADDVVAAITGLDATLDSARSTLDELRGLVMLLRQDPSSLLYGRVYAPAPAPSPRSPGSDERR